MPVSRHQIMNELELKLSNDGEIADEFAEIAERVVFHWKGLAADTLTAGYWTGEYAARIRKVGERGRHAAGTKNAAGKKIGGQFTWHWKVVNDAAHAHFIEYGTDEDDAPNWPDPPNAGGHWVDPEGVAHRSPWTPTPAFALAAQVEADSSGTQSRLPTTPGAIRGATQGRAKTRRRSAMGE